MPARTYADEEAEGEGLSIAATMAVIPGAVLIVVFAGLLIWDFREKRWQVRTRSSSESWIVSTNEMAALWASESGPHWLADRQFNRATFSA
jgi:hypothetical protein